MGKDTTMQAAVEPVAGKGVAANCTLYALQSVYSVTSNALFCEPPLRKMNPLTHKGVHLYHN